ncbi:NAD-dependent epimerase/dehydratase family protein [Mesobacillus maritimus]|uniref:NAD-dependent epimerase/dehydratase family protein n=1 Tax=Mesobacillus maritimus TaxID=1643336 RepID=UPI0038501DE0
MNKQPKLLITGGSGFTGQHACEHFLNAGFDVTAVIRKNQFFLNGLKIEGCDLTNKDEVKKLVTKVKPQYVLHLAGQNHVGQSWLDPIASLETNSMSTAYLIESLRQEVPFCKILVAGSALQFNPTNMSEITHPYSLSKTLQTLIAQSWGVMYNMHIVIAKPSNLIGPGCSNGVCSIFAQKIVAMENNKADRTLEVNNLSALRDFIDVRDAVSAYETLLLKGVPGEIYDISSGKERSLEEIINVLKSIAAVDFEVKTKSNQRIEPSIVAEPVKLMQLGWQPFFSLDTSLKDILDFYRRKIE